MDGPMVRLEIYRGDELIDAREVDIRSWYDGEVEEIDSGEMRFSKGITKIKGKQYDESGKLASSWCNCYDSAGKLGKSVEYDMRADAQ